MESDNEGISYAMAAACRIIWPAKMAICNTTEQVQLCEMMKKAFDAAFATGAIGMYEKNRGIPIPVPQRIIAWLEGNIAQIEMLRIAENTVSKRWLLNQLYVLADSAKAVLNDAKAHNANIKEVR